MFFFRGKNVFIFKNCIFTKLGRGKYAGGCRLSCLPYGHIAYMYFEIFHCSIKRLLFSAPIFYMEMKIIQWIASFSFSFIFTHVLPIWDSITSKEKLFTSNEIYFHVFSFLLYQFAVECHQYIVFTNKLFFLKNLGVLFTKIEEEISLFLLFRQTLNELLTLFGLNCIF